MVQSVNKFSMSRNKQQIAYFCCYIIQDILNNASGGGGKWPIAYITVFPVQKAGIYITKSIW